MSISNLINEVRDEIKTRTKVESLLKIVDTLLYSGKIRFGNLNDQFNCINRVAPHLTTEESNNIFQGLSEAGVVAGDLLEYKLTDKLEGDFVYSFDLGNSNLVFYKV